MTCRGCMQSVPIAQVASGGCEFPARQSVLSCGASQQFFDVNIRYNCASCLQMTCTEERGARAIPFPGVLQHLEGIKRTSKRRSSSKDFPADFPGWSHRIPYVLRGSAKVSPSSPL